LRLLMIFSCWIGWVFSFRQFDNHRSIAQAENRKGSGRRGRMNGVRKVTPPSFRGAPKVRTRNPEPNSVWVSGFRVRRCAPPRN